MTHLFFDSNYFSYNHHSSFSKGENMVTLAMFTDYMQQLFSLFLTS